MYQPIHSPRLYEQVVQQIEQRIVNSELEPGDKLPSEIELAAQFGVSRTVIRETIKALRAKGLVEVQLGRGTFVTGGASQILHSSLGQVLKTNDANYLKDLNELREILDPKMTALAVERADEMDIEAIQKALQTMEDSIHNVEAFLEADLSLYHLIAKATKNPLTTQLLYPIVNLLREQFIKVFSDAEGVKYKLTHDGRITHHKRILESIIHRDPQAAIDAMHDQLDTVRPRS